MQENGISFLESSNVGNNYGCYLEGYRERSNAPGDDRYDASNYVTVGDPQGLEPIMPSEFSPMSDDEGNPLPCIASNDLTVFSLFDTEAGTISSYVYDTREPDSEPQLFDVFTIGDAASE